MPDFAAALEHPPRSPRVLQRLPLATLYLTERCNSRCVTCDYWRTGQDDMSLADVERLLPALRQLKTEVVLLSGGEPLMNPEWMRIAELLADQGIKLWLLTSGLSLLKHAKRVVELMNAVTVSLDGTDRATYQAIRGLDAFDKVCDGIRAVSDLGLAPGVRVTVQRRNYRQLPDFVTLSQQLGARQVSFLAVDVANPHAFGRVASFSHDLTLDLEDLSELERVLSGLELRCQAQFKSGFIAESPAKLRRIHRYFTAIQGLAPYPDVHCNAPEFSAVIGATGKVQPCFFIAGPPAAQLDRAGKADAAAKQDLYGVLNDREMSGLRAAIREGVRRECKTCVCSLWRDSSSTNRPLL